MREKIKPRRDRNKRGSQQAAHKTLRPSRNGTVDTEKEKTRRAKAPEKIVRPVILKSRGETLEVVRQRMPAGVNDRPSPEIFENSDAPKHEAGQVRAQRLQRKRRPVAAARQQTLCWLPAENRHAVRRRVAITSRFFSRTIPDSSTPRTKIPRKTPCCFISTATPNNNPLQNKVSVRPDSNPRRSKTNPPSAAEITKCVAWARRPITVVLVDISA